MNYYIDLFSPETAEAFTKSGMKVSGYRSSRKAYIENKQIGPGDKFICYVTRLQRFVGILEVTSKYFEDHKPIFRNDNDPFILRFNVKPIVWLSLEMAIPIHTDHIWNNLSFTKTLSKDSNRWTYMVFSSPRVWPKEDCEFLEKLLLEQSQKQLTYPFSEKDQEKLKPQKIKINDRDELVVSIPAEEVKVVEPAKIIEKEKRESISIQAKLAQIGETLGFKIWLPNPDRKRVLEEWKPKEGSLLNDLPIAFEETTLRTIRNIDVLWINKRAIVRAFEVEDTTSIYSGILRMADLLALQPNLDIKIHIVAPLDRKDKVIAEITRPAFADINGKHLSDVCTYLTYDQVIELSKNPQLKNIKDTILDDIAQYAEEA